MGNITFDWMLHCEMVYKILTHCRYLQTRDIKFELDGYVIKRAGGWGYSPSEITSFRDAEEIFHDNGAAVDSHFDALLLLKGVSYHNLLDKGRALLKEIFENGY